MSETDYQTNYRPSREDATERFEHAAPPAADPDATVAFNMTQQRETAESAMTVGSFEPSARPNVPPIYVPPIVQEDVSGLEPATVPSDSTVALGDAANMASTPRQAAAETPAADVTAGIDELVTPVAAVAAREIEEPAAAVRTTQRASARPSVKGGTRRVATGHVRGADAASASSRRRSADARTRRASTESESTRPSAVRRPDRASAAGDTRRTTGSDAEGTPLDNVKSAVEGVSLPPAVQKILDSVPGAEWIKRIASIAVLIVALLIIINLVTCAAGAVSGAGKAASSSTSTAASSASSASASAAPVGVESPWTDDGRFSTGDTTLDSYIKELCDKHSTKDATFDSNAYDTYLYVSRTDYIERENNQSPWGPTWDVEYAKQYFEEGETGNRYNYAAVTEYVLKYFGYSDAEAEPCVVALESGAWDDHGLVFVTNKVDGTRCIVDDALSANGWMLDIDSYQYDVRNIGQNSTIQGNVDVLGDNDTPTRIPAGELTETDSASSESSNTDTSTDAEATQDDDTYQANDDAESYDETDETNEEPVYYEETYEDDGTTDETYYEDDGSTDESTDDGEVYYEETYEDDGYTEEA